MRHDTCHPETFREIFSRLAGELRRFAFYKSGDWAASEDMAQEAFLRLWKNCSEVPPDKARAFLYTTANHLFLDGARHQKVQFRFTEHEKSAPPGHAPSPETELEDREMDALLERALAALPEPQRVVFLMSRVEKLRYHEIAERLGLSVKAVEKRMHGALLELRKLTAL